MQSIPCNLDALSADDLAAFITVDTQAAAIADTRATLQEFRAHLALPKFSPEQADGSRGDWIATSDVRRWLDAITTALEN